MVINIITDGGTSDQYRFLRDLNRDLRSGDGIGSADRSNGGEYGKISGSVIARDCSAVCLDLGFYGVIQVCGGPREVFTTNT